MPPEQFELAKSLNSVDGSNSATLAALFWQEAVDIGVVTMREQERQGRQQLSAAANNTVIIGATGLGLLVRELDKSSVHRSATAGLVQHLFKEIRLPTDDLPLDTITADSWQVTNDLGHLASYAWLVAEEDGEHGSEPSLLSLFAKHAEARWAENRSKSYHDTGSHAEEARLAADRADLAWAKAHGGHVPLYHSDYFYATSERLSPGLTTDHGLVTIKVSMRKWPRRKEEHPAFTPITTRHALTAGRNVVVRFYPSVAIVALSLVDLRPLFLEKRPERDPERAYAAAYACLLAVVLFWSCRTFLHDQMPAECDLQDLRSAYGYVNAVQYISTSKRDEPDNVEAFDINGHDDFHRMRVAAECAGWLRRQAKDCALSHEDLTSLFEGAFNTIAAALRGDARLPTPP